jgi:hypothetical protein
MDQQKLDKLYEKVRMESVRIADKVPLPLHYILNGFLLVAYMGDLVILDPIPFVDEIFGAFAIWYYNIYILKRTFGIINPVRIFKGESPTNKRKLGLLPWEQQMDLIRRRLKNLRSAAKELGLPELSPDRVARLAREVKDLEKRLRLLDRLLTRPEFQEGRVRTEIARFQARGEMTDDTEMKSEWEQAIAHAHQHLQNIDRLRDERNRLVARLERFNLQLDNTYSQVLAMSASTEKAADIGRLFDELIATVGAFQVSLNEIERKPSSDLLQSAVQEVEATEARFKIRREDTNRTI